MLEPDGARAIFVASPVGGKSWSIHYIPIFGHALQKREMRRVLWEISAIFCKGGLPEREFVSKNSRIAH